MFKFTHKDLRKRPTIYEHTLWNYLRARQMLGCKFRRQHPMGPYVVDFACLAEKIIIELDGPVHHGREQYDFNRDRWLESKGFKVMRIRNEELQENLNAVLMKIRAVLLKRIF